MMSDNTLEFQGWCLCDISEIPHFAIDVNVFPIKTRFKNASCMQLYKLLM